LNNLPTFNWPENIVYTMALLGSAAGAITGGLLAVRRHMDLFGVVFLGVVAAIGGGTLRDLLFGNYPVFWIKDFNYFYVSAAAALATFLWLQHWPLPLSSLVACDAVALAMFSIAGADKVRLAGAPLGAAVLAGLISGVFGGVLRDVLAARQPYIMKSELYATTSLAGASVFVLMIQPFPNLASYAGVVTVLFLRWSALRWGWVLPSIKLAEERSDGA
jgi:uncharacterized membrane protein YeiH